MIHERYLTNAQMKQAIDECFVLAKDQGVEMAVMGTVALIKRGFGRLTKDVDFLVDRPLFSPFLRMSSDSLSGRGELPLSKVRVDVVVKIGEVKAFYLEAIKAAEVIDGIPYVSVPHIVAMKLTVPRWKHDHDVDALIAANWINATNRNVLKETLLKHFSSIPWNAFLEKEARISQQLSLDWRAGVDYE